VASITPVPVVCAVKTRFVSGSSGSVTGITTEIVVPGAPVCAAIAPITGGWQTRVTFTVKVWLELLDPSLTVIVTVAAPDLLVTGVIVAVTFGPTVMIVTSLIKSESDVLGMNVNCDSGVSA